MKEQHLASISDLMNQIERYKDLSGNDKLQLLIENFKSKTVCPYPFNFYDSETIIHLEELQKLRTRVIAGVAVFAYIKRETGTYVLFHQRKGSHGAGTWSIPGGHIDLSEQPKDAVRRETYEEFGLELKELHRAETVVTTHSPETGKSYVTLVYFAEIDGENSINGNVEPKIMEPDKCNAIKWVKFGHWGDLELFPCVKNFLQNSWNSNNDVEFIMKNMRSK